MFDWSNLAPDEVLLALRGLSEGAASGFLDTHQFSVLLDNPELRLNGGHPAAQYRRASLEAQPALIMWTCRRSDLPEGLGSARAIRQAWRSAGEAAWAVGDIIVGSESCWLASLPEAPVRGLIPAFEPGDTATELPGVQPERLTAASLRADAVIASLFKVSRGEAQTAIEYGFVFRNFRPLSQRTTQIRQGDELVYRTKGRIQIAEMEENSRSGRNWLSFRRFPC